MSADAIADVVTLLESRLAQIAEEDVRIRRALETFDPAKPTSSSPRERRKARRKPKGRRAGHGERRAQILAAIKESPDASPRELAEATGAGTTYVYGLVRKLQDSGQIKKNGKGFEIVG